MKKLIILLIFITIIGEFLYYGESFLVVSDQVERVDALVILAGDWDDALRIKYGIELIEKGYAHFLILPLRNRGSSWLSMVKEYKIQNRISPATVIIDYPNSIDANVDKKFGGTYTEARKAKELLEKYGFHSAIIISCPYHMRRARMIFNKIFEQSNIRLHFSPAPYANFCHRYWFFDNHRRFAVILEYIKLIGGHFVYP